MVPSLRTAVRSRPLDSTSRNTAMIGPQASEERTVSTSVGVRPEEATSAAYRCSLAWRAMVSYSAHSLVMLWLSAHVSVMVRVADLSAPELPKTYRRTSAGASSSGGSWEVARSGSYMVSTYSRLDSRPRVAMTYRGSRRMVAETNAWAVSTVLPWARWAVVA